MIGPTVTLTVRVSLGWTCWWGIRLEEFEVLSSSTTRGRVSTLVYA